MGVKKVTFFGDEVFDASGATVTASTLGKGVKAIDKLGDLIEGSATISTQTYYVGTGVPASSLGADGDIYLRIG